LTKYHLAPEKRFLSDLAEMSVADQKVIGSKLVLLEQNPFYPSLRTKKLRGRNDYYESSANMSIRIIWEFNDDPVDVYRDQSIRIISLLEVGQHDILKQY